MDEWLRARIRFDRNELAGAFGDIGTDLPLIIGMILAAGLPAVNVLVLFGVMQMITSLLYGIPMPAQPLKAMATLVIANKVAGNVLYGGGLAIGVIMLLLTVTGLIDWIVRVVPKCVVRGIQFGLGFQLASLALRDYVRSDGWAGFGLAAGGFVITIFLLGHRRYPPALFLVALGMMYAVVIRLDVETVRDSLGFALPTFQTPTLNDVLSGLTMLALPQLPLSIANSVIATRQTALDYFPDRAPSVRKIGFTYSLMNLISPFLGGVPTCHGSGGMAGHYSFGARTGGSTLIYGSFYLILGLLFGSGFQHIVQVFPLPILGVILAFEGLALSRLIADVAPSRSEFGIALLTGLMAIGLPNGYVIALVVGTILVRLSDKGLLGMARS
jgi:MFS superfamily sulfate permease-like transporter